MTYWDVFQLLGYKSASLHARFQSKNLGGYHFNNDQDAEHFAHNCLEKVLQIFNELIKDWIKKIKFKNFKLKFTKTLFFWIHSLLVY